jgi:hypothetical protein
VERGGTPVGVTFDEPYVVKTLAGNAVLDAETLECLAGFDGRLQSSKGNVSHGS